MRVSFWIALVFLFLAGAERAITNSGDFAVPWAAVLVILALDRPERRP